MANSSDRNLFTFVNKFKSARLTTWAIHFINTSAYFAHVFTVYSRAIPSCNSFLLLSPFSLSQEASAVHPLRLSMRARWFAEGGNEWTNKIYSPSFRALSSLLFEPLINLLFYLSLFFCCCYCCYCFCCGGGGGCRRKVPASELGTEGRPFSSASLADAIALREVCSQRFFPLPLSSHLSLSLSRFFQIIWSELKILWPFAFHLTWK